MNIRVIGLVQGVGFRISAKKKALSLGLTGWVKNETDGSVMAAVEGEEGKIQEFIAWCHKGPMLAEIENVDINKGPLEDYQNFEIRH